MELTFSAAQACNVSPFVVLEQDAETVIMVLNYLIEKADSKQGTKSSTSNPIQKNDGFWDF